jgi:hypothetical protein
MMDKFLLEPKVAEGTNTPGLPDFPWYNFPKKEKYTKRLQTY